MSRKSKRYAARLGYDGTPYAGFQRQSNAPSIQESVERVLSGYAGEPVSILGAGRTDAGVHATGQVIAFDLAWRHPPEALQRALNNDLPRSISVWEVWEAEPGFHPRFDAVLRRYEYRLYISRIRDPLRRHRAWQVVHPVDVDRMQRAAETMLGTHDFRSFGKPPQGKLTRSTVTVRVVKEVQWRCPAEHDYVFTIAANAFLYRMVRRTVGTLVRVGQGRMTIEDFRQLVEEPRAGLSLPIAPAHGLTLTAVEYE